MKLGHPGGHGPPPLSNAREGERKQNTHQQLSDPWWQATAWADLVQRTRNDPQKKLGANTPERRRGTKRQ